MLQKVLASMPNEEASYHMKRCVDSGLWVTDAKAAGIIYQFRLKLAVEVYDLSVPSLHMLTG